jgi:iron(III) transport system substrate-binding protein
MMTTQKSAFFICLITTIFLASEREQAFSASLPKSTQEMLSKLNLTADILSDIDKELRVPGEWLEKANQEGHLRIRTTPNGAQVTTAPFRERYPFIKIEVSGTNIEDRAVKTLMAYKSGRVIGDVIESVGDAFFEFKKADALEDLRDIPTMTNVLDKAKDSDGLWVAYGVSVYCMAYNTRLVKAGDLPKKWEDLLTNPAWRNGNLALANRPGNWAVSLWKSRGEEWTKQFLTRLFAEVEPQRRKEGLNALVPLVAAGEFHAVIPASHSNTYRVALDGAPVRLNCPEPAPSTISELVLVKRSPNIHAAKLYLNWVLSKEGQLARQLNLSSSPSHKGLQLKQFLPFAEEFVDKERGFVDLNDEQEVMPKLTNFWSSLWIRGRAGK